MNDTFQAAFLQLVSTTTCVVDPPTGDLGFGSDLSCWDDLEEQFTEFDGPNVLLVAQAIFRRITTPRGALSDDPDYGIDLLSFLNRGVLESDVLTLRGALIAEIGKDDRIADGTISVSITRSGRELTVYISAETAEGPFTLTLAASDAGILLKEFSANGNAV